MANKYVLLWTQEVSFIKEAARKGGDSKRLEKQSFEQVGDRNLYSFRLDINEPKISGSAVARDLLKVLKGDSEFLEIAKQKHIVIKMGIDFILKVEVPDKI